MFGPYHILMPLFGLFFLRVDVIDLVPITKKVNVLKILDSDTVVVSWGGLPQRIRLSKVDGPELGQPFLNNKGDAGRAAKACAARIILQRKELQLHLEGRDIYGRWLGELDHVSLKMVENGCVSLYPHAVFASRSEKYTFVRALLKAKTEGKGLWARGGYLQPKLWRKKQRISKRSALRQ